MNVVNSVFRCEGHIGTYVHGKKICITLVFLKNFCANNDIMHGGGNAGIVPIFKEFTLGESSELVNRVARTNFVCPCGTCTTSFAKHSF
ncbi:MAG: hypothetical protein B6D34_13135 [Candidatus Brocadia sp. UTAMX1]|jgi:hypothetical protein|nr:MAG: hypothetical protein B6D34_13135 [Candidatus Brocadia sp. UTAMX1]